MEKIFTIGFTKKTAECFFGLLKDKKISVVIDIRRNNTSQLSGFSKYPDIKFFLNKICSINYISDINFAPTEQILKDYKSNKIAWDEYVVQFNELMESVKIKEYIEKEYDRYRSDNICLLCSEERPDKCHRSLVAKYFKNVLRGEIIDL